jgi:transposase
VCPRARGDAGHPRGALRAGARQCRRGPQRPGRKSDVSDAVLLADLLAHGLIRASFVPPAPIQALRDLTRTRKQLVRQVAQHTLRMQKTLEDANLKLTGIVTDLLGPSGRAILRRRAAASSSAVAPAALAEALTGRVTAHHRFMLDHLLRHIEFLDSAITAYDRHVETLTAAHAAQLSRLDTIPGVARRTAEVIRPNSGAT